MTKFSDLKLDPKVLKAIADAGYETPTPIQAGAIPPALEGRDVLGIAQTGTGKTASFTLPMITLLGRGRARARMPRSLVLCPTRELAAQVAENFDVYAKHTRLTKALLIGGVSFNEQDKLIDRGVDVLIATPGRLLDHFERGKLLLTGVQIMVVDEADRMLDMGFIPDIERIFQMTPFTRQTLFFSATMAPEIERITNTFLHAPERIEVARQATASETITQRLIEITPTRRDQSAKQKRELLRALIDAEGDKLTNAIIFCNRKTEVDIVAKSLAKYGYDAAPIHGDLDQSARTRTLDGFREGKLRLLIASDVAARGLDIPAVSHVFNFDLPSHAEDYVHRIGRTGRAGRSGTAISIATPSDDKYLAAIEGLVKQTLPRVEVPQGFAVTDQSGADDRGGRERDDRRGGRDRKGRGRDGGTTAAHDERPRAERSRTAASTDDIVPNSPAPDASRADPARDVTAAPDIPMQENTPMQQETRTDRAPVASDRSEPRGSSSRSGDQRRSGQSSNNHRGNGGSASNQGRDGDRSGGRQGAQDSNRRDRGRDENRGPAVTGMGDHVPEFMLVELRRVIETLQAGGFERTAATTEDAADADATPATPTRTSTSRSSSRSGSGRSSRSRRTAPGNEEEQRAVADTVPMPGDTAVQETPADASVPAADAPKPKSGRRKKVTPEAVEESAVGSDVQVPPKPARKPRSRKTAPADPVDATAGDVAAPAEAPAADAPKPKTSRRKKADPTPGDPASAEVISGEQVAAQPAKRPAKPRSRARKPVADDLASPAAPNNADADA